MSKKPSRLSPVQVLSAALALLPCLAVAAEPSIGIELNRTDQVEEACRFTLVLDNRGPDLYDALTLDIVLFGKDGVVERRITVDAAPLRAAKTSVKLFDVRPLPCERVGRMLLNDVVACRAGSVPVTDCVDRVTVSSRSAITLVR